MTPSYAELQALLAQRNQQLVAITRTWDMLRLTSDLDALLTAIVAAAHETLGFATVVLNVRNQIDQTVTVRAHAGLNDDARALLAGAVYPWQTFAQLLDPRFQHGRCYFVPSGAFDWTQAFDGAVYVPVTTPHPADAEAWTPDDALFVVVEQQDAQIAGIISLDQPHDGRRPSAGVLQALEIFSTQVAIALENAQFYTQMLEAHRVALRQLDTPLLPLTDTILVLPLVGAVDTVRAQQLREDVLAGIAVHQTAILVCDVTGVPILDREAATAFANTVYAVQLLGAQVILTGVHPALAQALVALLTTFGAVRTYGTLQQGVRAALGTAPARAGRRG